MSAAESIEKGKLTLLALLTLFTVILYLAASAYAMWQGEISYKEFSAAVRPISGILAARRGNDAKIESPNRRNS